jgi:hypothetical protein
MSEDALLDQAAQLIADARVACLKLAIPLRVGVPEGAPQPHARRVLCLGAMENRPRLPGKSSAAWSPEQIVIGALVFALGVLAGAGVAACVVPPNRSSDPSRLSLMGAAMAMTADERERYGCSPARRNGIATTERRTMRAGRRLIEVKWLTITNAGRRALAM